MLPTYEKKKIAEGCCYVIGCDEVGRGCLAGPVVAGAVVLGPVEQQPWFHLVKDSKQLTPAARESLSEKIKGHALAWSLGVVESPIIDKMNIHNATLLAMRRAVEKILKNVSCESQKLFLYIDGKFAIPEIDLPQQAVVQGDGKIFSVAAASIIAKVYRDGLMKKLHVKFPQYDFERHKGYATLVHRQAILKHGLSEVHRKSFCKNFAQ